MKKKLLITKKNRNIFSCLLDENDKLIDMSMDDIKASCVVDNIYIGRVVNVLPNIHASFVEFMKDQMGFIPEILKEGDKVIVQVIKDSIKGKEPVLSRHPVLTGKYAILTTRHPGLHFSYKFNDDEKKAALKKSYDEKGPYDCGFIVRTKSVFVDVETIMLEMNELYDEYKNIEKSGKEKKLFSKIYEAMPSHKQYILNSRKNEFIKIVTDDENIYVDLKEYLLRYQKEDLDKLEFYGDDKKISLSVLYGLKKQLFEILTRKVYLPSGGHLIIEHTEALTVIDVNSASDVSNKPSSREYLSINLEAAKETARQIRARNISGIILIDFINMSNAEDKKILVETFKKYLDQDPMGPNVVDMTKLGIIEVTRKRAKKPVAEVIDERFFDQ